MLSPRFRRWLGQRSAQRNPARRWTPAFRYATRPGGPCLEEGRRLCPTAAASRRLCPQSSKEYAQPDNCGKDVFVHISAVERAGLSSLNEGAKVSYEETENRGKVSAENLRVG
jgi:CspA family cold shock protein